MGAAKLERSTEKTTTEKCRPYAHPASSVTKDPVHRSAAAEKSLSYSGQSADPQKNKPRSDSSGTGASAARPREGGKPQTAGNGLGRRTGRWWGSEDTVE